MHIFTLCRVILLALSISFALSIPVTQVCNYKSIEMLDVEITNMGSFVDKKKTYLEVVERKGKKVAAGILVFLRDLPLAAEVKWDVFSTDENNRAKKQAEGKQTPFCNFLVQQKPMADMLIKHSNLPATCAYKKGVYNVTGAGPDEKILPCKSPGKANLWECKIKITEGLNRKVIMEILQKYRLIR